MYGPIMAQAVTTSPSHGGLPAFIGNDRSVTLVQLSISPKKLAQDIQLLNIKKGWTVSIYLCLELLQEPQNTSGRGLKPQL